MEIALAAALFVYVSLPAITQIRLYFAPPDPGACPAPARPGFQIETDDAWDGTGDRGRARRRTGRNTSRVVVAAEAARPRFRGSGPATFKYEPGRRRP